MTYIKPSLISGLNALVLDEISKKALIDQEKYLLTILPDLVREQFCTQGIILWSMGTILWSMGIILGVPNMFF